MIDLPSFIAWFWANVWPNLFASAICFGLSTALTLWKLRQHHRQHMAKLNAIHEYVKANSNVA